MSTAVKKKVIMPGEFFETPVGAFFRDLGWDLLDKVEESQLKECRFILNDYLPELKECPRIKTIPGLVMDPELEKLVRGSFDQELIENPEVAQLMHAQFEQGPDYDFIERYSQNLKKVFMLKIHDYLNVGYFIDTMVIEAYKAKFDYDGIRAYLNDFILHALREVEKNTEQQYVEVAYSFNEKAFAVQLSFEKKEFQLEEEFVANKEQLSSFAERASYFDVNYFSKRGKLTLSALWFKAPALSKFHSYFLNETTNKIIEATTLEIHSGLEEKEAITYIPRENDQGKKLTLARKFALFIKNYRKNEEYPKATEKLEVLDVEYYLTFYPRKDALTEVDSEIKKFILKLLKDETLYDGISDFVKRVADSGLDDQTQEITRILSGKSLDDLEETLIIHGQREDLADGFTRVKGQAEEPDDTKQVITNVTEDLSNNDKWEIKKSQINEKIEEEVIRIKAEGRNVLKDDIVKVVSGQLDVSEENVKIIVGGIVEEAISHDIVKNQSLEEALAQKILAPSAPVPDVAKEKLEAQIARMKKLMEQMKQEMLRLKEENSLKAVNTSITPSSEVGPETLKLKTALSKTMQALKSKDKMLEKVRSDNEMLMIEKNNKIHMLEERISSIKSDYAQSSEFANQEKVFQLEVENKNLQAKLELANKKVNIISDNMTSKGNEEIQKKDKELTTLKTSIQMAQVLIERFKQEKTDLENRLQMEKEASRRMKEDFDSRMKSGSLGSQVDAESEIQSLQAEKKALEEKFKLQGIELKKLEQKLKFTTSQLDSSMKKKAVQANQKSNEAYIKQLEQANHRLSDASNEIAEKKKEVLKLKQENGSLNSKLAELEKKLNSLDKKAA